MSSKLLWKLCLSFFDTNRHLPWLQPLHNCLSLSSPAKGQSIQDNKRTSTTSFGVPLNLQGSLSIKKCSRKTRIDCFASEHRSYLHSTIASDYSRRFAYLRYYIWSSDCRASSATQAQSIQDNKQTSTTSIVELFDANEHFYRHRWFRQVLQDWNTPQATSFHSISQIESASH